MTSLLHCGLQDGEKQLTTGIYSVYCDYLVNELSLFACICLIVFCVNSILAELQNEAVLLEYVCGVTLLDNRAGTVNFHCVFACAYVCVCRACMGACVDVRMALSL